MNAIFNSTLNRWYEKILFENLLMKGLRHWLRYCRVDVCNMCLWWKRRLVWRWVFCGAKRRLKLVSCWIIASCSLLTAATKQIGLLPTRSVIKSTSATHNNWNRADAQHLPGRRTIIQWAHLIKIKRWASTLLRLFQRENSLVQVNEFWRVQIKRSHTSSNRQQNSSHYRTLKKFSLDYYQVPLWRWVTNLKCVHQEMVCCKKLLLLLLLLLHNIHIRYTAPNLKSIAV